MNEETKELRKKILRLSNKKRAGHIPSAFSILEILYALYGNVLGDLDKFILSKGHGSLALYATFLQFGVVNQHTFDSFTDFESPLGGHPDRNKLEEIVASTGSLGHGLPISVGLALSKKIKKEKGSIYCLVGDGECNEGSIWESALLASNYSLDNLVCIVDNNNSQERSVPTRGVEAKFSSFGWEVITVNGHNISDISKSLTYKPTNAPLCIVANTVKGYGIKAMSDDMFAWHHGPPTDEQLEEFVRELG